MVRIANKVRDGPVAGQSDAQVWGRNAAPGVLEAHTVACVLRTAVLNTMLQLAAPAFQNNETATHISTILAQQNDAVVFRARPGHQQPREERAWTWIFAHKETAEAQDRLVLEKLMSVRCKKMIFAPLHSQDVQRSIFL